MFDEPVNGLDPEGIHWIRNLMKALAAEGRTVFVSSHLMSEMALTADHLIVIGQGKLLADTSMADFIRENSRSFVRLRSPQQERLRDVLHAEGVTVVEAGNGALEIDGEAPSSIGELAARHGIVLHELSSQRASLEEAFMQMTAGSVEYHAHSARDGPAARRRRSRGRGTGGAARHGKGLSHGIGTRGPPVGVDQDPFGLLHHLDPGLRVPRHRRHGRLICGAARRTSSTICRSERSPSTRPSSASPG